MTTKECPFCKKVFKVEKKVGKPKKYCSSSCYYKDYRKRHLEKVKGYFQKHYAKNKDEILRKQKIYLKTKGKKVRQKLVEKYKQDGTIRKYNQKKYQNLKNDPQKHALFKIIHNCRKRVRQSVKTNDVKRSDQQIVELIGCTSLFLKKHLEKQFKPGMSWDNYGSYWEVDHIIPISNFDITIKSERNKANHYTNLQPLEANINRKLGAKKSSNKI